jgi:hypothetical protein
MSLLNDKFLFVHINKSGGGVITDNMKKNGNTKITGFHRSLEKMLSLAKEKHKLDFNNLYTFTMVRNPFERMLSMYLFYHKNNFNRQEFFSGNNEIDNDFNNWIEYIYSDKFDKNRIHSDVNIFKYCFSNQLNWLKDKHGNLMKIDKILRFEKDEYEDLFGNIMKLKNYDTKTKVHPTKHNHYSQYYNEKSIKLVTKHYQEDLDYFGYNFD